MRKQRRCMGDSVGITVKEAIVAGGDPNSQLPALHHIEVLPWRAFGAGFRRLAVGREAGWLSLHQQAKGVR